MPVLLSVKLDDAALQEWAGATLQAIEDPGALYHDLGQHLVASVEDRFDTETDPSGTPWEPLSPATLVSAARRRGIRQTKRGAGGKRVATAAATRFAEQKKILFQDGALRGSIAYEASPDGLRVGTPLAYGRIHQLGGEAGRKDARVTIPARAFLGLTEADRRAFGRIITRHLRRAS